MERPDPDELLGKIQRDEAQARRGQLKIFFGASAGVGKTFAMLQAAHRRLTEGVDVLVGIVETHGRLETLALLDGLEVLPLSSHAYQGRLLEEFDLDAALRRKPQLILVDELAHSNVPGARHMKRWRDVHELLDAGIDVYTTVNVQHLESLNDIVGQITGIRVSETVPDRVFDLADDVTLVDLPAAELLERLRDGKVYMPEQAEHAVRNFFRKGNLIALRELALRRTADRVDAQMREYRADKAIAPIWHARERLIACIGSGIESAALVRAAARLAASLKTEWFAVHVETPGAPRQSTAARKRSVDALRLAADLGAETVMLNGTDAAQTLIAYAQMRNVSKLVIGAPSVPGWRRWLKPSVGQTLLRSAHDIDVTLIAGRNDAAQASAAMRTETRARGLFGTRFLDAYNRDQSSAPSAYAIAVAIAAGITGIASVLLDHIDLSNLVMLYLLGVIFASARLGRGPGAVLALLSVAAFDFFFVPPRLSLTVSDSQYLLTFAVMLLTSLTISHLTYSLRRQARLAASRERRTGVMYAMARELGAALSTAQIIEIGRRHVSEVFQARVAILLPDSAERMRRSIDDNDPGVGLTQADIDFDVAQWVYDRQEIAGHGTATLPGSSAVYLPLKAPMRTRGVLALATDHPSDELSPEQQQTMNTFAAQIALALERVHYVDIAQDALVNMESERLRNSLLSAISHDLRTPLTSIVGLASMLAELEAPQEQALQATRELSAAIHEEALRMTGLVTNLLDMARLQAGGVRLNRQWSSMEEVVGAALAACRRTLGVRKVQVHLPPSLPLVQLDPVLMEHLFSNLLENAAKYTPAGAALAIEAAVAHDGEHRFIKISIDDNGAGLPSGVGASLFDKFTRGEKESNKPGMGLGLAICQAIMDAHEGRIGAENRLGADGAVIGARFWFMLPADDAPPAEAPEEPTDDLWSGSSSNLPNDVPGDPSGNIAADRSKDSR
ncbi:MAG: DUF4118 domain-containing protein [Janthinobacterium lividum]